MINRRELRKKMPRGYCKEVAIRSGVSTQSVSRYFNYRQNSERIENTVLDILAEISQRKKEKLDNIL